MPKFVTTPVEMLATLRTSWVNLPANAKGTGVPTDVKLSTPAQTPIAKLSLPPTLNNMLAAQPKTNWVKLIHALNGKIVTVVDDGSALPPDESIVHVQVTTSTLTANNNVTDTYVVIGQLEAAHITPIKR